MFHLKIFIDNYYFQATLAPPFELATTNTAMMYKYFREQILDMFCTTLKMYYCLVVFTIHAMYSV